MPVSLPFGDGQFHTVYADPPWPEFGGGRIRRGANRHYPLMSVTDIAMMGNEVKRIADDNSHCYIWTTNNHLHDGLRVLALWGYRYITTITWVKDRMGLGQYFRGMTEHCLFGVRGRLPYRTVDGKRAQGRTMIWSLRHEHSAKPEEMREMIERVSWPDYLELFARRRADGWAGWGNELLAEAK